MLERLYNLLERLASWQVVALLFVLFVLCAQGFELRRQKLGFENTALDGRGWYSAEEARDFFHNIKEEGRQLYYTTELTLDLLFPLVYGTLFASLIVRVYDGESAKYLAPVPLLAAVFDVLENVTLSCLAWQFDGRASPAARGAAVLTAVKVGLFILSFVLILWGALRSIWRTSRPVA